jgi:hypothetical protein
VRLEGSGAAAGLARMAARGLLAERDLDAALARTVALAGV